MEGQLNLCPIWLPRRTVFRSSIERWADGLKSPEMQMHGISAMKRAPERPPDVSEMIMSILKCYISQTGLAHFHISTVLTLKMHKNGLEKNRPQPPLFMISSRGGLTHPKSHTKESDWANLGQFIYRVTKLGTFYISLVFFALFLLSTQKCPTLAYWLAF